MPKKLIYIAMPYASGDPVINTHDAIILGNFLSALGYIPVIPHLTLLWHIVWPKPPQFWYDYDLEILKRCDAVLRLGGESVGADNEVKVAKEKGIPVYFSIEEMNRAFIPCSSTA